MSDDLVNRICQQWIDAGYADECFWEVWPPGDPAPEDGLTPRMVLDRIQELEAKLEKAVDFVRRTIRHAGNSGDDFLADKARAILAELKGNSAAGARKDRRR